MLAITAADAVALDLAQQPISEDYMFPSYRTGSASPLWNLRIVEAKNGAAPMLHDSRRLGPW